MIDPRSITNFSRTEAEIEEFMLFAPAVAGKTATVQAQKLDQFLEDERSPFDYVRSLTEEGRLRQEMERVGLGKYTVLEKCYTELVQHKASDLLGSGVEALKEIHGIGDKTARFLVMHSVEDSNVATLDTHILSWMQENTDAEISESSPRSTAEYEALEQVFIKAAKLRNLAPAKLDLQIWKNRSRS